MNKEFKKLQSENENIRYRIYVIMNKYIPSIDDNYSDLKELMESLIENEIEQEKLCGQ